MTHLSDRAVAHLREVADWPELPGDRYQVVALIGEGGMGRVYRAHDRVLGRDVALKVLRPELAGAAQVGDLQQEARILARLEHPGIVPVHDVGVLADGRIFSLMKLVRGQGLEQAIQELALLARLRLFLKIAEAVAFAHASGVVHRDLKPGNVMVGAFGEVLVLDWGLAAVQGALPEGGAAGTPGFMPPEQRLGAPADARGDIYALGRLLGEMATVSGTEPPRPLRAIASRAAAAAPDARYPTVAALAADVTRFLDGEPVAAYDEPLLERLGRWYGKYQTAIVLILTYLIVRLIVAGWRGV
ncbi:MAG: serine/threonine-protein kinase [Gemmatimonadales bacterium]